MRALVTVTVGLVLLACPAILRAEQKSVSMQNLKFKPQEVTVRVGDTVVWTNDDDRDHTIASDDGSFRSGRLGSGRSYQYTFTKPGKYPYGDNSFSRMRGVVVVVAK
jgi:plastocyanin